MPSIDTLNDFANAKLEKLRNIDRERLLVPTVRRQENYIERSGQSLVSFCDNDYLSLSTELRVIEASKRALKEYGIGAGASRLVTGSNPLNDALEQKLASMKGTESARIFGSGYMANIGTIPCLVGKGDTIFLDEYSHACMYAGAQLSPAKKVVFHHNDVADLELKLQNHRCEGNVLVLTETVFSMDGDIAPLRDIHNVCEKYGAWLMTDDAHGFGIIHIDNPAPIQMGTLSKAAGSYGGYVCGPEAVMHLLTNRARSLIFTTGLPPAILAASLQALEIMEVEPERARQVIENARYFCSLIELSEPGSAIVPVICGTDMAALKASRSLSDQGLLVAAIRPPTVPEGTARLRITFTSSHRRDDIERLANVLRQEKVVA